MKYLGFDVYAIAKRLAIAIATGFMLLSFMLPAWAVEVQAVPNPRQIYGGWVSDMANLRSWQDSR